MIVFSVVLLLLILVKNYIIKIVKTGFYIERESNIRRILWIK